tara:strand:- start:1147 stop:1587 length:441 start_codon:yes stop_codon:yes gene_type:complete
MANPMYGLNKHDEVLHDLAKMFVAGKAGGSASLQITAIEKVIDAESTTDITCTDAMPGSGNAASQIWGGYIEVSGISGGATVDLDFGHTNHLTIYQEAVSANGLYGLDAPSYEAAAEDVVITITTNGSTSPIKCRMVFLSCVPVTS